MKVQIAGRLGGSEMSRVLAEREGPRAPLDAAVARRVRLRLEARTTYGVIGVKCWIYKGDIDRGQKVNYRVTSAAGGRYERRSASAAVDVAVGAVVDAVVEEPR